MSKKNISVGLVFYIIISQFVSDSIGLALLIIGIFYYLFRFHFVFNFDLPGKYIYISMFLMSVAIGIAGVSIGNHTLYLTLKHAYYFITPSLYWILAIQLKRTGRITRIKIINSLLFAAILYSSYDVVNALMTIFSKSYSSINQFRHIIGTSNFLALIGIYVLLSYGREIHLAKQQRIISYIICFTSVVIHFSRMILMDLFIFVVFSGILKDYKKVFRIIVPVLLVLVLMIILMPTEIQQLFAKLTGASVEVQVFSDTWSHSSIVKNWRGYEVYCELRRFNSASTVEKIIGGGFGTSLDVFGYAYLVTTESNLSVLHNGYFTELMLGGILGVVGNIIWYIKLYMANRNIQELNDRMAYKCLVIVMVVSTYFVKGPLYSSMNIFLFYLALFYDKKRISLNQSRRVRSK